MFGTLAIAQRLPGMAQVTMSRPAVFNAFDDAMIGALAAAFACLAAGNAVPLFEAREGAASEAKLKLGKSLCRCWSTRAGWTMGSAHLLPTAAEVAAPLGAHNVVVFDRALQASGALACAAAPGCSEAWRTQALAWLTEQGHEPLLVADTPGLMVARTVAMLINEASDAVLQGVCTPDRADAAMKLGVNYPAGPFEWLAGWSVSGVVAVLDALDAQYRGERYRVSRWLCRQA